jgi:hypothetical protein
VNLLSRPTSTLGRAVLPVAGGALLLAALLGLLWAVAAWMSSDGRPAERLAPTTFDVGDVATFSERIAESGPLLFPGLNTTSGERTLVLNHTGHDPAEGWRLYWAYPADRGRTCTVEQVEDTDRFVDCDGRDLAVGDLAAAEGTCPIVESRRDLKIGLRPGVCGQTDD